MRAGALFMLCKNGYRQNWVSYRGYTLRLSQISGMRNPRFILQKGSCEGLFFYEDDAVSAA
ncbi:hypothetical protein BN1002_04624 [Bacillus sp. B-jedd]|nr:hypothetical protein BN1002_04624 [Bacillus sp. B-jedd]